MRIAIVDDEEEVREAARQYLAKMLAQYWSKETAVVQIDLFASAEAFLVCFDKQPYDLVILDICMPDIDGMEAAHRLRAESADVGIIFLTTSEEYLMEGYRVFADGYFLKPLGADEDAFRAALRHVFARRDQSLRVLNMEYNGRALEIPFQKIFYVDIEGGRLHVVLEEQAFHFSRPFTYEWSAERLLCDKRFLECYHRIIVNMDRIEIMEEGAFVLTSGMRLPISRRRYGAVKVAYMQYMLNR
ncbi:LytR/AlgR family response regulator transcription factor [Selenomonas sp.]|uniref:LytR/AlgR family response regulator transcription factor n=1 Tax=Selenomonas sp. TaxID=2053611 RepID=UPI003FA1ECA6